MFSLALHIIRGKYTFVFYISLCLNVRARERTFKHPIFRFEKGSQSNAKLPLEPNNTTKIRTIFVIANFFFFFFFPPYRAIRKGKSLLYRYVFIIFVMLKYKRL